MTIERLTTSLPTSERFSRAVQTCGVAVGTVALSLGVVTPIGNRVAWGQEQPTVDRRAIAPAAISAIAPPADPTPAPAPFAPVRAGITEVTKDASSINSVGHLRPRDIDSSANNGLEWIESVNLPLYVTPGGDHWGWIYQGWLIPKGQTYLAIGRDAGFAMVRSYENLYTFPVLETRADGWFWVQYTPGGSAWAHVSQLNLGEMPLAIETWESRLQDQGSVYFLNSRKAQALRSQPQQTTNMISLIAADSLIEPLEFQGDWMRVRATRPIANCEPLTGAAVSEGWMRWRGEQRESLVWYRPEGGCAK